MCPSSFVRAIKKGGKLMESWMSLVSDVGFPIVVTLYLLHRIEQKLDTLNDTILQLPEHLNVQKLDKSIES
jgi:uncharacterized Fe-S cluster-containing protein